MQRTTRRGCQGVAKRERVKMEPKTYPLFMSFFDKVMIFGMLGIFTAGGLFLLLGSPVIPAKGGPPPMVIGIFWLGMVSGVWCWILSIPYKIQVHETTEIEFISRMRRRRIKAMEIQSIKPERSQFGFLVIRHTGGKIKILNQFDGFHEFIADVKRNNPSVELRGC